jgi:sugar lactone lactonase YvrE
MDPEGNLYVADSSAGSIYEIPNEAAVLDSNGKVITQGLNLKDQFVVSSGLNVAVAVAVNSRGDMYYTAANATSISELTLGNANFNAVAVEQSANRVLNFQFNAAATVTNIQAPSGDFTIQPPAVGTTACAKTSYGPGATKNCQITVGFAPSKVGKESSAVVLTYTIGTTTQTATAFVEGIGQGALLTLDPGTVTPAGSGFKSPAGVAVDHAGNTFIADPGNNSVTEFPTGGGAAVTVTIGGVTPSLSAPAGVAVDGAGDVFIADTGNNRVVEVPFVNGALNPTGSTIIASGLKSPASVFVHTNGDLYVADTGANTILVYPNFAGTTNNGALFGAPTSLGVGLSAPLAVTVDGPGNVYIADSGNNQILEYPLGAGQEIVAANILNPSALATDSSGSLFVVDQGNFRVLRIPSVQGTLNPNDTAEVGLGVASPYGVAIDASSNLYVTDRTNAAAYTIARSQIGLAFGDLAVGTPSTALPLTVESAGNLPLIFNTPYFTETGNAGDFAMTSPTGACANGLTMATGINCDLATTFTPTVAGSRSATIAFSSNAANVPVPQVTLTGTGVTPSATTTTLALIPSVAGAPFYGEPLSFTATIAPATGTGVVSFVLDGTQIALVSVVKGVATLQLNSGLLGGQHSIYADYKGDTADNASSSAVMPITISRAPTTPILTVTKITYNTPYSLRHSNAGSCSVLDSQFVTNTISFPAIPNDPIGFTASVTSVGVGVPSGTLTFYSDGKLINGGSPPAPNISLVAGGGTFPNNQTVYVLLTLTDDFGETTAGAIASTTTTALNEGVRVSLANSYGTATGVKIYEADVASGSAAPSTYHLVASYALGASPVIATTATGGTPTKNNISSIPVLPYPGGLFSGNMTSDANTLGDGTTLGENNVLVTPHVITVVYSGDQNYLPSTSTGTTVTVTDVSTITNFTGTTATSSMSVTAVSATTGLAVGQFVTGVGIPAGTTIAAIGSGTITLSAAATASGIAVSLTASFTPTILPPTPFGPAPYCTASSTITTSQPSDPSTFTVTASSTSITASASAPGTTVLTINSLGGWTGAVEFSCPDLPQFATCTTNPGEDSVVGPSTPGSPLLPTQVVLTVTTNVPPYVPTATLSGFFWLASVVLGFLLILSRLRFRKAAGGLTIVGLALLLFAGIAGSSGCSSSTTSAVVTPPGTYAFHLVVTGAQADGYILSKRQSFRSDMPYQMAFTLNVK